jgi:hypothetical protein
VYVRTQCVCTSLAAGAIADSAHAAAGPRALTPTVVHIHACMRRPRRHTSARSPQTLCPRLPLHRALHRSRPNSPHTPHARTLRRPLPPPSCSLAPRSCFRRRRRSHRRSPRSPAGPPGAFPRHAPATSPNPTARPPATRSSRHVQHAPPRPCRP